MKNYRASPFWFLFDRLLRKHPDYRRIKRSWMREDALSGKGEKELLFEKIWPLIFFIGFAVFMLVLQH